jgi:hypothetical protein
MLDEYISETPEFATIEHGQKYLMQKRHAAFMQNEIMGLSLRFSDVEIVCPKL